MKKLNYLITLLALVAVTLFTACEKNDNINKIEKKDNEKALIFQKNLKNAQLHSKCLSFIQKNINETSFSLFDTNGKFLSPYSETNMGVLKELSKSFCNENKVDGAFLQNNIYSIIASTAKDTQSKTIFRSSSDAEEIILPKFAEDFLADLNKLEVSASDTTEVSLVKEVEKILFDDKYKGLTQEEFNMISYIGAIYIDSFTYWVENLDSWRTTLQGTQTRGFWRDLWKEAKRVAGDDAEGAGLTMAAGLATAATGVGAPVGAVEIASGAAVSSVYGCIKRIIR